MRHVRAITGIWHAAAVLCAAAFALAWCLAFPFAPAYADEGGAGASVEDDTIVVTMPTTVPCALLSDGTVATPTSWKVENSGSIPARLAMATATTAYDGISISAKAGGSTLLDYSGGFASYDPTLIVPAKGSLDVSWAVSPIDPAAHADLFEQAAQHPVTLLSASFLFCAQSTEPSASDSVPFAVYSEDDASLTFYKRRALPAEGSMFEGKTATAVYANIENTKSTPPWKGIARKIERVAVVDDGVAPQTMYAWFFECNNLVSVNLSKLDTSQTTSLGYAFSRCTSLTGIDLSTLDTSSVRSFADVFQDCSSLRSVNLTGWDTSSGKDFRQMFYRCSSLEEVDISSFETSASTSFEQMFYSCSSLRSLDLSHFDTGNATTFASMFYNCASLATLDVSMFNTAAATDLSQVFYGCKSLTELDLSRASTAKVQTFYGMFSGCSKLAEVTLGESFAWVGSKCFLPQPSAADIPGADGLWHAASDGAAYRPSAVPGNKADTYRAVVPGGEGDDVEDDTDVANGTDSAGAAEDASNAGRAGSESAADAAGGASTPNSENRVIAAEGMMAAAREDYMTALAMANPIAAAPRVLA